MYEIDFNDINVKLDLVGDFIEEHEPCCKDTQVIVAIAGLINAGVESKAELLSFLPLIGYRRGHVAHMIAKYAGSDPATANWQIEPDNTLRLLGGELHSPPPGDRFDHLFL